MAHQVNFLSSTSFCIVLDILLFQTSSNLSKSCMDPTGIGSQPSQWHRKQLEFASIAIVLCGKLQDPNIGSLAFLPRGMFLSLYEYSGFRLDNTSIISLSISPPFLPPDDVNLTHHHALIVPVRSIVMFEEHTLIGRQHVHGQI